MKKIIYYVGLITLAIVLIMNLLLTANLDQAEHITISFNSIIYIIGLIASSILIFWGASKLDKYLSDETKKPKAKKRDIIFLIALAIYIAFNIIWAIEVRPGIGGDQIHVANFAQTIYRDDPNEFLPNLTYASIPLRDYIQGYKQQIPLAFIYSIFFSIIHCDIVVILRALNVIGNIAIVFALYKIGKQLSKKYEINKVLLLTLIVTFISLPMLSTFIYGDLPGLALSLFSVYYIMKYTETKKLKFCLLSSLLAMVGYMMRMNSLIFIIATVMYLVLNLIKDIRENRKERLEANINTNKENLRKSYILETAIIVIYVVIAIIPSNIVENYYMDKYDMDKTKGIPKINYFLMGMEESGRGNGWYNEGTGEPALKNPEGIKEEYKIRIKDRLKYFSNHIGEAIDFYTKKIASMWTENTYSAVMNNKTSDDDPKLGMVGPLTFYQKVLLIITTLCSIIVLVQNRKNISLELLFLLTIFIGGFAFHILWEAKSRYIIPYIVVLVPLASVKIDFKAIKEKITKAKEKFANK